MHQWRGHWYEMAGHYCPARVSCTLRVQIQGKREDGGSITCVNFFQERSIPTDNLFAFSTSHECDVFVKVGVDL